MKINLRKAYDSVFWDFVVELMVLLKFPTIFIKWVMACISTPTYSLHLNGEDCDTFEGGRGLRQGDPLSPLLFVMVMEYLSRLFIKASKEKGFKTHPHCRNTNLMHLIYVDDLIVFSAADPVIVKIIMEAFGNFSKSTGLYANKDKS